MTTQELAVYFAKYKVQFVQILTQLVSQRSHSLDVDDINAFVQNLELMFNAVHPSVDRHATKNGDILSLSFFQDVEESIVLLAHMDTVKFMTLPPVRIEGDRFYGSGCYDMKNAIVLFYFAMVAIRDLKLNTNAHIKIILTPDEEVGSKASMSFLLKACKGAKAVLLPEPCCPDGGIKIRRKGVVEIHAILHGKAAHSGIEPEKGRDANRGLANLIHKIDEILRNYPDVSFNPGVLSGGTGINIVSAESCLHGELRSYSNDSLNKAIAAIKKIKAIDGILVNLATEPHHPALEFNDRNRRLYEVAKGIAHELGHELLTCASGGASDGSSLSAAGIAVLDGLGMRGGGAHSLDEYVELDDFPFRAALLTRLCQEI